MCAAHLEIGEEHQLVGLPLGMAAEQLIHRAAGRLGDVGVQQRGWADDQHPAGLGLAGRRGRDEKAEVAVGDPAGSRTCPKALRSRRSTPLVPPVVALSSARG
jgi:hypothetical protein